MLTSAWYEVRTEILRLIIRHSYILLNAKITLAVASRDIV